MTSQRGLGKRILSSKVLLLISLFILIYFSVNLIKEVINRRDLQREVNKLQAEIDGLEGRNKELGSLIEYFKTMDFVEKEARLKLNLRKPGEHIIIVPEEKEEDTKPEGQVSSLIKAEIKTASNPQRWLNYFFESK